MDEYKQKIERILSNKLEYNGDHKKAIEETHIWLQAEWQGSDMKMDECNELHTYIDECAKEIIRNF